MQVRLHKNATTTPKTRVLTRTEKDPDLEVSAR